MSRLFNRPAPTAFHDKAWKRASTPDWDARWASLSLPARRFLLDSLKLPQGQAKGLNALATADPPVRTELLDKGLISLDERGTAFTATPLAVALVGRLRALKRWALLGESPQFEHYLGTVFATFDLGTVLANIVEKQTGLGRYRVGGDVFALFVRRHFWAEWVADSLNDPLARPLIAAVEQSATPVPVTRLVESLPGHDAQAVRATLDRLVNHLVLFEDVDPQSFDLIIGLLPEVRRGQLTHRQRKVPTLEPVEAVEVGPDFGYEVSDLRALLVEVNAQPARIKQDRSLFSKERERFLQALDPLPAWMNAESEERVNDALRWAYALRLVDSHLARDKALLLELTSAGRTWLTLDRETQGDRLFHELRETSYSSMYPHLGNDAAFLGASHVVSVADEKGLRHFSYYDSLPVEKRRPLREAVLGLLMQLPLRTFFVLDEFLPWAGQRERNPLLLGRPPRDHVVRDTTRVIPPVDEFLDEACRVLFRGLIYGRLVGLGGVQLGRDARGQLLFARLPRLEAYFGRPVERGPAVEMPTRVIIQPDFSVIIIGPDPTPVADLVPLSDRVRGTGSQGATTYRLSRDSVFRAVADGLKGEEVLARLRKHASTGIPANVLTEVQGWCEQMRRVSSTSSVTLLRCPDAETAARVLSVLGKQGERISDTAVAMTGKLTPGQRQKLLARGVIIENARERKKREGR